MYRSGNAEAPVCGPSALGGCRDAVLPTAIHVDDSRREDVCVIAYESCGSSSQISGEAARTDCTPKRTLRRGAVVAVSVGGNQRQGSGVGRRGSAPIRSAESQTI